MSSLDVHAEGLLDLVESVIEVPRLIEGARKRFLAITAELAEAGDAIVTSVVLEELPKIYSSLFYLLALIILKPFYSLSVFPEAWACFLSNHEVHP